jgi:hypothetical protein
MKEAILDGQYIRVVLGNTFIQGNEYYGTNNLLMAKLIYGFDDTSEMFQMLGFIEGQYMTIDVPYLNFEKLFCSIS